jgi:hypothetical protein
VLFPGDRLNENVSDDDPTTWMVTHEASVGEMRSSTTMGAYRGHPGWQVAGSHCYMNLERERACSQVGGWKSTQPSFLAFCH